MEPIGAFLESEWDFLNKMFANEGVDFMPQFAAGHSSPNLFGQGEEVHLDIHPTFCPAYQADMSMTMENENLFYSIDAFIPNGLGGGNVFFVNPSHPICPSNTKLSDNVSVNNSNCMAVDISVDEIYVNSFDSTSVTDILMEDTLSLGDNSNGDTMIIPQNQPGPSANPGNKTKLKRKLEVQDMPVHAEGKSKAPVESQKKKPRVSRDARRSKRNTQPKKTTQNQTADASVEDETGFALTSDLQSSSSCSAEEDNTSHETNGVVTSSSSNALNSNGKTRASRGSATDPQSLYARRRRERINERLRILQNLVPNGTKVDISTMLEEAVHYVKFLQLQIKLLSSDDLWMYAPIAYNGMDIALNLSKRLSSSL